MITLRFKLIWEILQSEYCVVQTVRLLKIKLAEMIQLARVLISSLLEKFESLA